jgi:RNA polymerase-binding protein DksA
MQAAQLDAYKKQLTALRVRLMREVDASEEALREDVSTPGDSSGVPSHPADSNAEGVEPEIAIAQNEGQLLGQVEQALERIEAGTFGKCQACGCEISSERLDALPFAAYCIQCARQNDHEPPRPKRGEPRRFRD